MTYGLFLYGEDTLEDVKQIRADALSALAEGRIIEWNGLNNSVKKVESFPLDQVIKECNYFLRLYDPDVKAVNPIITETIPFLYFT